MNFWRTRNALSRIRLAFSPLIPAFIQDLHIHSITFIWNILRSTNIHKDIKSIAIKFGIVKNNNQNQKNNLSHYLTVKSSQTTQEKPIIFVSYCASAEFGGNLKFCGGTKELNYLVKLLRERGYEAYFVTYDGTYEPWLLDHQPHISLDKFQEIIKQNNNIRCVTSWATATAFIQASPSLYFWDMELAYTENHHFPVLAKLYRDKIKNTAAISRTIQAWHMAHFKRSCVIIPNLLDTSLWVSNPLNRKKHRIGYMNEGIHTQDYINTIRDFTQKKNLELEFHQISGVESEILGEMQTCEVFLSMNIGKDCLWGEGCPRTVIESLASGCVIIAFDIIGNRETIQDNFNGVLVSCYRPDLMAEALVQIYTSTGEIKRLQENANALIESCHTFDARWPTVKEFLHL
ncbi:glycosyltransferase Gtf1 [Nostoc carneum NIES-2107]|nr:glycosyltransferase Gtf1 [Nostoc carneum NIES-2107]